MGGGRVNLLIIYHKMKRSHKFFTTNLLLPKPLKRSEVMLPIKRPILSGPRVKAFKVFVDPQTFSYLSLCHHNINSSVIIFPNFTNLS